MTAPDDGDPVAPERSILRLPKPPPDFEPDEYLPSADYFELSTDEKNGNGRLSVWDEELTTVAEARAFRGIAEPLVLRGRCGAVLEAGAAIGKGLEIVYEPLESPLSAEPGAAGHAGIVGLRRGKNESRKLYRDLREAVADCFELVF